MEKVFRLSLLRLSIICGYTHFSQQAQAQVTSEPGPYWTSERRPLLQYVKLLVSAAQQGDAAEVSWFLRNVPAELSDLQPEAFHCALLVAVLRGHHSTAEALLQHQHSDKGPLFLPVCSPGEPRGFGAPIAWKSAGPETSFLALSYGWDSFSGYKSEEERFKQNGSLCGAQCSSMMRLLLKYGVAPASAVHGLLQKLAMTTDIAAANFLQAYNFDLGGCVMSDGQTMLHLLVSAHYHVGSRGLSGSYLSDSDRKEWQDQAMPLLQLLLFTEGANTSELLAGALPRRVLEPNMSPNTTNSTTKEQSSRCLKVGEAKFKQGSNACVAHRVVATACYGGATCMLCLAKLTPLAMLPEPHTFRAG